MDREGLYTGRARSEAAMSYASRPYSQPPCCSQVSLLDQLSPKNDLYTNQSAIDEHKLVCPAFNTDIFKEEKRQEQQEDEEHWDDDGEGQLQHGVNVAAIWTAKSGNDISLSSKKGESARLPK